MSYISSKHLKKTCKNLTSFYSGLASVYKISGMSIEENRGRRNILMSAPMEHFLAKALQADHKKVENDGRTGKADIVITFKDNTVRELECKLTSPHASSGSIAFQTDFETLSKKKELDYIYLVANPNFDGFCAIHFKGLTPSDFHSLSPGARGKVQMIKHKAMKKSTVLMGNAINLTERSALKRQKKLNDYKASIEESIKKWTNDLDQISETQIHKRKNLLEKIERAQNNLTNKINKENNIIKMKLQQKARYRFEFESLEAK